MFIDLITGFHGLADWTLFELDHIYFFPDNVLIIGIGRTEFSQKEPEEMVEENLQVNLRKCHYTKS